MKRRLIAALVSATLLTPLAVEAGPLPGALKEKVREAIKERVITESVRDKGGVKSFQGQSQEGTGIRRAAPGTFIAGTTKEDAERPRPRTLAELFQGFVGSSAEGTGIRRAAPGTFIAGTTKEDAEQPRPRTLLELFQGFQGTSAEGTGI